MPDQQIRPPIVAEADTAIGKQKKDKVRAAWISFVGRIVAQFIGAAASILLGLIFMHKYQEPARSARADGVAVSTTAAQTPLMTRAQQNPSHPSINPSHPSIAVLPLEDYSLGGQEDQFANGMTEAVITALSNVGGLRVISRTSSMRYKGTSKALPAIGRELAVDWIIEGSVVRSAHSIRVTGQLIDTATDEHLWATAYDRGYQKDSLLAVQADIASQIAKDVDVEIRRERHRRLTESTGANAFFPTASTPRSSHRPVGTAGSQPSAGWEGIRSPAIRSRFPAS